MLFKALEIF